MRKAHNSRDQSQRPSNRKTRPRVLVAKNPARLPNRNNTHHLQPYGERMSFFAGGGGSGHRNNNHGTGHSHSFFGPSSSNNTRPGYARSSSSFFSRGGSSSHYKRRPRDGYITYLVAKLKRLIADLWYYARKHPVKAFFAIVVPLMSAGGALHGLLKQFGIRLPEAFDGTSRTYRASGSYYGNSGFGSSQFGGGNAMGTVGSLFKIAQAFM